MINLSKRFINHISSYKYTTALICFFISLWGLFLRFRAFSERLLYTDELYQLRSNAGAFKNILMRNNYGDFSSFPGEYVLNYPFIRFFAHAKIAAGNHIHTAMREVFQIQMLNSVKWFLIIPYIPIAILGFYFLYLLCKKYCKTRWGYVIAFLVFSCNLTLISYGLRLRPYSMLPTITLGVFYFSHILVFRYENLSIIKRFLIGAFFLFAVFFHVYGIIILTFSVTYILMVYRRDNKEKRIPKSLLKFLLIIFIIGSIMWLWYASLNLGIGGNQKIFSGSKDTFEFIANPLVNSVAFFRSCMGNLLGQKKLAWTLLGMIAALFLPQKNRSKQWAFLLIFIVLSIELILVMALKKRYWFLQRQFIWTMPLFAFFLGWCWDSSVNYLSCKYAKFFKQTS